MARLIQHSVGYKRVCKRGQLEAVGVRTGKATIQHKTGGRMPFRKFINFKKLNEMRTRLDSDRVFVLDELVNEIKLNSAMSADDIFLKIGKKMKQINVKYPGAAEKLYRAAVKLGAIHFGGN